MRSTYEPFDLLLTKNGKKLKAIAEQAGFTDSQLWKLRKQPYKISTEKMVELSKVTGVEFVILVKSALEAKKICTKTLQ